LQSNFDERNERKDALNFFAFVFTFLQH
jgi:hypothetical protein